MIASAKEIDALNITLFNSCINFTNVRPCNYCTKIFVIAVNTGVCRRSVDNKALILSYPDVILAGGLNHRFPCRYLPPCSHLDHWSVNTRWTSCIPAFTLSFETENLEFTAVNEWNPAFCGRFPVFSETVNTAESRKIACIPAFTDRLPLGKLRVIPTFASSFLAFSLIFRDSEFK